jgi:hypothetical protein
VSGGPDPESRAHSNGKHGLLAGVSEKLIRALPPAFLVLTLLNIGFIGMAAYIFQHNTEQRNTLLTKIIESCLLNKPEQR